MTRKIRPIRIEGNVAYVPLTRGLQAIIDASYAEFVGRWNWFAIKNKKNFYAARHAKASEKLTLLHGIIMPVDDGYVLDHIDGDGLNNRRDNLRPATSAQNAWNSRRNGGSPLGFTGISQRPSGAWRARITVRGERTHLGDFATEDEAGMAYMRAAAALHGDFAPKRSWVARHGPDCGFLHLYEKGPSLSAGAV